MNQIYEELKAITAEKNILTEEVMAKHTSFGTGGIADFYVTPDSVEELKQILTLSHPITVLGNGSNVLVTDRGIRGIVVSLRNLNHYEVQGETILADCGVPLAKLSQVACEAGLTGLEFACGIPGTVGGAVFMNAGAYGGEMKDVVSSTTYLDRQTKEIKSCWDHEFVYRGSVYHHKIDGIILSVTLQLKQGNRKEIQEKMEQNKMARLQKQPVQQKSAGSTFKRKDGIVVAKLIDEAGLKGYRIGGAEVSTVHAGFIVNTGNATSQDILDLVKYVQTKIRETYDIEIEPEIKILGEQ